MTSTNPLAAESMSENKRKMLAGELYFAFDPELIEARARCKYACDRYNTAGEVSRRRLVELWRDILDDQTPLPPKAGTPKEDDALFESEPWIEPPVRIDYGYNTKIGPGSFINFNCTILDTCTVSVGARTLVGPNVSFYSGTHPLDPGLRDGTRGPELGKPITVEEDCWIGGNVTILPGVTLGRGCVIGAASVVTKDVPPYCVVAGNPAKIFRRLDPSEMSGQHGQASRGQGSINGAEEVIKKESDE